MKMTPKVYNDYYRYVYKMVRNKYRNFYPKGLDFEDIVQEVWLKVIKSMHTYDPDKSQFGTWLNVINNTVYANILSHLSQQKRDGQEISFESIEYNMDYEPDYISEVYYDELLEDIKNSQYKFKDDLINYIFADLDVSEIAKQQNVQPRTIYYRLKTGGRKIYGDK